jgi:hypothetical protein
MGSTLDAHATHPLGISHGVSDHLFLTLGLGQSSCADDEARVTASATALQLPWVVDILGKVHTFPAEYSIFRLLLDRISAELLKRRSAPALAPAPAHAHAPGASGTATKIAFYTSDRLTHKQLPFSFCYTLFLLLQALDHDMIYDNVQCLFSSDRFLMRKRSTPKRDHGVQTAKLFITEWEDCYAGFCAAARAVWGIRTSTDTNSSVGAFKSLQD